VVKRSKHKTNTQAKKSEAEKTNLARIAATRATCTNTLGKTGKLAEGFWVRKKYQKNTKANIKQHRCFATP
jgi:hypothetical protein